MEGKALKFFTLSSKEESVMNVLWNTDEELCASKIADRIPDRDWPASSVQGVLRSLEKKNAIVVSSITKLGKSYGRLFRPNLSANEYATMQFNRYYQNSEKDCFSVVSSLLGNNLDSNEKIIKMLYTLIDKYKKEQ